MIFHELKTWPNYYTAVEQGIKKFEIRYNADRGFQKGDWITLKEFDPHKPGTVSGGYTKREIKAVITYVTNYQQQPDYVVFGFSILNARQIPDPPEVE